MTAAVRVSSAGYRLTGSLILHAASQCELVGMAWHVKRTSLPEAQANHLRCGSRLQVNEFVRSPNGWIITIASGPEVTMEYLPGSCG